MEIMQLIGSLIQLPTGIAQFVGAGIQFCLAAEIFSITGLIGGQTGFILGASSGQCGLQLIQVALCESSADL